MLIVIVVMKEFFVVFNFELQEYPLKDKNYGISKDPLLFLFLCF
jgi:hypothetical protein